MRQRFTIPLVLSNEPPDQRRFSVHLMCVVLLLAGLSIPPAMAQSEKGPGRERFVPADQLDAIFERSPNGVMLQRDRFEELLELAQQAEIENSAIPTAFVIRASRYKVEQVNEHAIVNLTMEIEQFSDHWVTIDIPIGNLLVENATIADTAATVGQSPDEPNVLTLIHREPGRFSLDVKLSTPLTSVGSDKIAAFRIISTATSMITVACPEKRHLEVNDLRLARPNSIDKDTEYSVPAGGLNEVRLKWTARQQQTETDTLVFALTGAQMLLSSNNIRWESTTRISVFGNTVSRLVARIPNTLEVTNVDSAGLEEWKLEDDADQQGYTRLLLNYRQPFSDDRIIRLSAVAALNGQHATKAPALEFQGVTAHSGQLYVQHQDQLRLMATVSSGIRHVGTNPVDAKHPASEVFDFWLQDYSLDVAVKPRDRELFAEINSTLSIVDTSADFNCDATIETLNAPLFELPLQLPDGWQLTQVTDAQNQALKWREGSKNNQIVVEPKTAIAANQLFSFRVSLTKAINDPASERTLSLPVITATDTLQVGGTYQISATDDLAVSPLEMSGLTPIGDSSGTLMFETQGTTYSGNLAVARKPARLATRAVIRSWMDTRQKTVDATITVDVVNGTTRTLQLQLPENLGEEVRFEIVSIGQVPGFPTQQTPNGLRIVEQSAAGIVDGVRTFDVTVNERFVGALTLKTQINLPPDGETKLKAPFIRVVGAVRQHGLLAFEAYPDQQLTHSADDTTAFGLEAADPGLVDPPAAASGRRTALVYRFIKSEYSLTVTEDRYATEAVPSAVCEKIANISVLSESGTTQRSCCVHFQCSGVQTLRFSLPGAEQSYLWSTVLNGSAVEVRRDGDNFLVAIPSNHGSNGHVLEILFESTAKLSVLGELNQRSVKLSIDTEQGKATPIDVLEQTWEVRYPSSTMLIDHNGGFQPQQTLEPPGWLQQFSSLLYLPSWDTVLQRGLPVGFVALVLFIVTVLISRRRWKSLCGFAAVSLLLCLIVPSAFFRIQEPTASVNFADHDAESFESAEGTIMKFNVDGAPMEVADGAEMGAMGSGMAGLDEASSETDFTRIAGPFNGTRRSLRERGEQLNRQSQANELPFGEVELSNQAQPPPVLPNRDSGATNPLFDEMKRINAPRDDFAGQAVGLASPDTSSGDGAGLQSHTIRNLSPNFLPPVNQETTTRDTNGNAAFDVYHDGIGMVVAPQKQAGAARLSIRAGVASPVDYQSLKFRSIDSIQDASTLQLVVQKRSRINALRMIAAAIVLLLCLFTRSTSTVTRCSLALVLIMAALAAVPLVPNPWQSTVDGVFLGTFAGIGLWVLSACCSYCAALWQHFRANGCCGFLKARTATLSVLAAAAFVTAPQHSSAAPQENQSPSATTRPDVVLPYSPDQPELLADRVFLPKNEFLNLYRKAHPESLHKHAAPADASVVAAFYKSGDRQQVRDSRASDGNWAQSFTVRYVINSFQNKVNVQLPIGSVAIRSATLDEATALLQPQAETAAPLIRHAPNEPEQQAVPQQVQQLQQIQQKGAPAPPSKGYSVYVPEAGLHLLDVVFEVPATIEEAVGRLEIPLSPVAVGTLSFELPDKKLKALVNGRSNVFRTQGTVITIPIAKANRTQIEWRPQDAQDSSNTIYHANVNSALIINDAGLTVKSSAEIRIRQGQLSEVNITLPREHVVQKVDGSNIGSWSVADGDVTKLKVLFQQPVSDLANVQLTLFRRQVFSNEEQKIDVPTVSIQGASRDFGNVTVLAGRELEVRVDSLSGVSQLNAAESVLPPGVDQDERRVLAWRYTRHPVTISVRVFRTADRLMVTSLNGVQVESQRQLWTTLLKATISGAPRRRLEVGVSADFMALDVSGNDLTDWYYTEGTAADRKVLNLQFSEAKTGTVNVVIQGQSGRAADLSQVTLNPPQVFAADESSTSEISIWLDAASTIRNYSATGWTKTNGNAAILSLKPLEPGISFLSSGASLAPVSLTIDEAAAAVVCESVSVTNITDTSVELTLGLNWEISGNAAIRDLSFSVPEALAETYDFHIPGLRQLEKFKENNRVIFTIHLQQPVTTRFFVLGTGTLPLPKSKQLVAQPPKFRMDDDSKSSITNQSHFWVIVNQSSGLLEAVDQQSDGADISEHDIKINIPVALLQQAVAIRRLKSDHPNSAWQLKFPKRQQVAPAVVALAAHTTIISGDGTWRSRHELQVRNESRQFLPVRIPQASRFLFCLVQGRPVRVVSKDHNDATLHLIPIPQSGELAAPFTLEFALSGIAPTLPLSQSARNIAIPAPEFPEYRDDPEFGIAVSRNTWSVYTPKDWRAEIIKDPKQTNVVPASSEDFEDAAVLSNVDNLKSIINSLSLNSGKSSRGSKLYSSLEKQRSILQNQRGNTNLAEGERTQTLQQLEEVLSEADYSDDYVGKPTGINRYLESNEALQNDFNNVNSLDFITNNGGVGLDTAALNGSPIQKFNFPLPELAAPQASTSRSRAPGRSSLAKKNKAMELLQSELQIEQQGAANRSQLLERRESNRKAQVNKAKGQAQDTKARMIQNINRKDIANAADSFADFNQATSVIDAGETVSVSVENTPAGTGQLSLKFQIPTDGDRHDFVRTGGNTVLTLSVRNTESIRKALAIAWAVLCAIVAVLLLRSQSKGSKPFLKNTMLMMTLAGLAGWICLPNALRFLALLLYTACLILICLTAIVSSFRKSAAA